MSEISENNKRIAKNTLYLYIRMFVTMLVGLYTSRVVLNSLGVSDYGVYNVMGGIIGMLTYVNSLLSGGTSRFLTMDLGKGDMDNLNKTFAMSNALGVSAAAIILVLGESIGLWFMSTQLNIEPNRMNAALWVYQCALLSCCITTIQTPFTASIIAHEKMDFYAYMSIFDVSMKLLIALMLIYIDFDKLKLYAVLMFSVNALNFLIYSLICNRKFSECKFRFAFNGGRFKEMMNYSGWNMLGAFANILNNYGLNILLNIFFGTIVNAARGIALQVSNIVQQFYSNIQTASRPQIMKYYAVGDVKGMSDLICNTSKYCTLLLMCIVIPICFNIDGFLMLWLGQNPEYTAWFTRVILMQIIFSSLDLPVGMGIHAVGRMKLPNITSAIFYLAVFPMTYICFKLGANPIAGYCVYLCFTPFILLVDLLILRLYTGFKISDYFYNVLKPCLIIAFISSLLSYIESYYIGHNGLISFILNCAASFITTSIITIFLGLSKNMRLRLLNKSKMFLKNIC